MSEVKYHTAATAPAPLPFRIRLSDGRTRTNPATFTDAEIADAGYTLSPDKPAHDPATERVEWGATSEQWQVVALPVPAQPTPEPRPLTRLEFIRLGMIDGGMTPTMLVNAKDDPNLAAFWILLDMAQEIERDDADTVQGLNALEAKGYLPGGAQAVLDAWPTE